MWRKDQLLADHGPAAGPENNRRQDPELLSGHLQESRLVSRNEAGKMFQI